MSESYYYRWMELLGLEPIIKKVKAERRVSPVGEITERGLRDYTPFKYVYEDEPEKLEELIEETIDLKPLERKRVLNHVKAFPDEPIETKKILARPEPIMLTIQFSATVATGLEEAAEDRFTSREDIVKIATEDWLKENEYLEEE